MPGTTRDAIEIDFERGGVSYTLIDTAGLRRRGKVFEAVEKFSVIKTLQAIEACNVVLLMLDAQTEISDQDAHIAGFVLETGRRSEEHTSELQSIMRLSYAVFCL